MTNLQQLVDETKILARATIGDAEFELSHNTRTDSYTVAYSHQYTSGHAWFPRTVKDRRAKAIREFLEDIRDELEKA